MPYRFSCYHPYSTFNDRLNVRHFIKPNGRREEELTAATAALFRIGKEAYELLYKDSLVNDTSAEYCSSVEIGSHEDFDRVVLAEYFEFIALLRETFQEMTSLGKLNVASSDGDVLRGVDCADFQDNQIVNIAWQVFSCVGTDAPGLTKHQYAHLFAVHALISIDDALLAMLFDSRDAVAAAIEASEALANAVAIYADNEKLEEARRKMSFRGAMAKIANDPRQREKAFVFECWKDWQNTPASYPSKAKFARDMLEKCEHLTSTKKIEDWCREWERTHSAG